MAIEHDKEERGLPPHHHHSNNNLYAEEDGTPGAPGFSERAEIHEAEGSPLVWSEAKRTWITPEEAIEADGEATTLQASSSSVDSPSGSQNAITSGGGKQVKKPVRAISALSEGEPIYVQFEDEDPDNPFEWPKKKKWIMTGIGAWLTTLVAIAGPGFVAGTASMQRELNLSHIMASLAFSLYPLGFGLGPLVLAPISEVYGRNPMYFVSTILFTLCYLPIALANNLPLICVFRFLSGVTGSVGSTMVGGTIADIWVARERGKAMAFFSIGAFAGTGFGLVFFGYVEQNLDWRWIEWIQMIMAGVTSALVIIFFRETRGNVILSKRAKKLRQETGDQRYQCRADEERASLAVLIKTGVSRPLWFLISEPIVLSLSIWIGFSWGCLYGLVEAIPLVYSNVYGWRIGAVGLAFLSVVLGAFIGWALNRFQEKAYKKHHPTKGMEARLWFSMIGGITFATGSMIFAWAIKGHWIGPLIGVTILISGIYSIYQGVFIYLADAYTIYASSAMSAQSFARNFMGFIFPLFITQMYNNLGYSWAAFLLACIAYVLAVIPFVLYRYGSRIRARSPAAIALARQLEEAERKREERQAARRERLAQRAAAGLDVPPTSEKREVA
ncbi:MFS general substrate transporter [Cystobasidium minutum MCA 4210]|uniref:MFS general substrate transporter n=1 Tax=Cystobasidium minutum MCA 4210 TaxID=1397322 RepID=UPI0034CFE2FC|eukprot:jgi/Rhomi1/163124/estExt_Genewise1Plus.C_7_t10152